MASSSSAPASSDEKRTAPTTLEEKRTFIQQQLLQCNQFENAFKKIRATIQDDKDLPIPLLNLLADASATIALANTAIDRLYRTHLAITADLALIAPSTLQNASLDEARVMQINDEKKHQALKKCLSDIDYHYQNARWFAEDASNTIKILIQQAQERSSKLPEKVLAPPHNRPRAPSLFTFSPPVKKMEAIDAIHIIRRAILIDSKDSEEFKKNLNPLTRGVKTKIWVQQDKDIYKQQDNILLPRIMREINRLVRDSISASEAAAVLNKIKQLLTKKSGNDNTDNIGIRICQAIFNALQIDADYPMLCQKLVIELGKVKPEKWKITDLHLYTEPLPCYSVAVDRNALHY